jgi:DNA-directed RNA polymerase II subunit RPB2
MDIARYVVETYLKDNPNVMVRHQLDSFNDFLSTKIPLFIKESNPIKLSLDDRRIEIWIGGLNSSEISFKSPTDEISILPHACRLENKTYAFDLRADIDVQYIFPDETETVSFKDILLGQIPLLLKSSLCYLRGMTPDELYDAGECKFELGGYFVITGQERVLLTQESLGANMFYAQKRIEGPSQQQIRTSTEKEIKTILENHSKENKYEYICGVYSESEDGTTKGRHLVVIPPELKQESDPQKIAKEKDYGKFSTNRVATLILSGFTNPVPLFSIFYALGFTTDRDIYDATLLGVHERTMYDTLFTELVLSHEKFLDQEKLKQEDQTEDVNLYILRRETRTRGTGSVFSNLFTRLFPHCERQQETTISFFKRKGLLLGHMFKMAMDVALKKENTDRDHFKFKRLEASGELMFTEFRRIYREIVARMVLELDRRVEFEQVTYKGKQLSNLIQEEGLRSFYWKPYVFLQEYEKSFKGTWQGNTGVSQVLSRISYLGTISHLRRINLVIDKSIKLVSIRKLHSSTWGYLCPIDNPDGKSIGIVKSLGLFAKISNHTSIGSIKDLLSNKIIPLTQINPSTWNILWTKVFLNSDLIGAAQDTETFHQELLALRRSGEIDKSVSLTWNRLENVYEIFCDAGRLLRYVYRENTKPELIKRLNWESMESHMDLIDPSETECLKISMQPFASIPSEIHPSTLFSPSASINPYIDHNQAPRNMFAAQQIKQACSWANTAFNKRFDTLSVHSHYVERPLTQTWTTQHILAGGCLSYGQNAIVAIAIYGGYNQEDSIILNKNSIKRGLFDLTYYHSYDEFETVVDYATQNHTLITNLTTDPRFRETVPRKMGVEYGFLDSEGIIKPGSKVFADTVLIGMVTPKTNELGQIEVYRDISVLPKKGQLGIVDAVYRYTTAEGLQGVKIRISEGRQPIIGDKFGSRHGQKGTCGILLDEEDMPCTAEGLRPDMIINPHALPSRMTIGQFLDTMGSKAAAHLGVFMDGTPFTTQNRVQDTGELLTQIGYHPYGNELLYNGQNGELIQAEVFMGPTFYERFKHMVEDKINYRSTGPRTLMTHQPVEGRANGGGLRIGEMERDALLGHGLSRFIQESMMTRSDAHEFLFQQETGLLDYTDEYPEQKREMPYCAGLYIHEMESMHLSVKLS